MTLAEIRRRFPVAGSVLHRVVEFDGIPAEAVEGLSVPALERIDIGASTERDVLLLLQARAVARRRGYARG